MPSSRYASKTAFDALAVDQSDYSEPESDVEPQSSQQQQQTQSTPAKITKTAQKKAAKEAREAKKLAKQRIQEQSTPSKQTTATPEPASPKVNGAGSSHAPHASAVRANHSAAADDEADVKPPPVVPAQDSTVATPADAKEEQQKPLPPAPAQATAPVAAPKTEPARSTSPGISTAAPAHPAQPYKSLANGKRRSNADIAKELTDAIDDGKKQEERKAYWKKVRERTVFTLLMIGGFIGLLLLGHPYMILLVLVIQVLVYREVTALFNIPGRPSVTGGAPKRGPPRPASSTYASEDEDDEEGGGREQRRKEELWSKTLSWYFFAVANYFLYGESLIYYFKHIVFVDAYFIPFARHHRFLSFMLYTLGFMAFVSGLKRDNLKHQIGLFSWVHMSLLLTVFSSHFIVNNILEGLIWFWVPASLVICNDVFAYVCGMAFGRTPLISLSPKKTVEGFVGAFLITEVFAYGWATFFQRYQYMICPAVSLGMNAFNNVTCDVNQVFVWQQLPLPDVIATPLTQLLAPLLGEGTRVTSIPYTLFQLHALVMAAFASLVAPFGGFFASGFKRAFNIKDFGDSIPGHGGLTDRFDCQFLMGLFSYVYYSSLIREHHVTVGSVLQTVVNHLGSDEQLELYAELSRYLRGQSLLK